MSCCNRCDGLNNCSMIWLRLVCLLCVASVETGSGTICIWANLTSPTALHALRKTCCLWVRGVVDGLPTLQPRNLWPSLRGAVRGTHAACTCALTAVQEGGPAQPEHLFALSRCLVPCQWLGITLSASD